MSGRLPKYGLSEDSLSQRIGCVSVLCAYSDSPFAQAPIGEIVPELCRAIEGCDLSLTLNAAHQPVGATLPGIRLFPFDNAHNGPAVRVGPAPPPGSARGEGVYEMIGAAMMLLSQSDYHRPHPVNTYVHVELIPPLQADQFHIYRDKAGLPAALLTWARLSAEIEREIHLTARSLHPSEWRSGDRLFFNDLVAPNGAARGLVTKMKTELFPSELASSFRRRADGSPPKLCHWHGSRAARPARPAPPRRVAFTPDIASTGVRREDRLEQGAND